MKQKKLPRAHKEPKILNKIKTAQVTKIRNNTE